MRDRKFVLPTQTPEQSERVRQSLRDAERRSTPSPSATPAIIQNGTLVRVVGGVIP